MCEAIGVYDKSKIPDQRMTASTVFNGAFDATRGRLWHQGIGGSWEPRYPAGSRADWLQVDMGAVVSVCAVATQGNGYLYPDWVTAYKVRLSTDGVAWNFYQENNVEKVSVRTT